MVLSGVHLLEGNRPTAGQTPGSVQCLVSDLALYPLPANIRMESIDFENLILQHVKRHLNGRNVGATDCDSTLDMINETIDTASTHEITGELTRAPKADCQFAVSLEPNRLAWVALKSGADLGDKLDFSRHCCYMQTSFSEIKLCYVNIQLPNIIIWLLSSIPRKIVKKETLNTTRCDSQPASVTKQKSLFALVWRCFSEIDVAKLRQAYKHLRSMNKARAVEPSLIGKLVKEKEFDQSNTKLHDTDMHSLLGQKGVPVDNKSGQHILSRQRQPAKLIHENAIYLSTPPVAHHPTLERKPVVLSQKKGFSGQIRSFANTSEFDTTQINNYLSHTGKSTKSCATNSIGSPKARTRSRSVESPRHHFRLMYKPICDDIEILVPSRTIKHEMRRKGRIEDRGGKDKKPKDYSDSLNSEGSSLSDESTSGEFVPSSLEYELFHLAKLNAEMPPKGGNPIVIKSVLKKSSSYFEGGRVTRSGFYASNCSPRERTKSTSDSQKLSGNGRQCANNCSKKNVTFSAYATIQVVDN